MEQSSTLVKNMLEKQEIRNYIKNLRMQLAPSEHEAMSRMIASKVEASPEYRNARCIYSYVDFGNEAATKGIIAHALTEGKRVAVPKVHGDRMDFYYIRSISELEEGCFGVLEPVVLDPAGEEEALMLMPGVAFDENGHRIGYGKGYYDKYLSIHENHYKMALAFDFQVFSEIPFEDTDICTDEIITETRDIKTGK